MTGLKIHETTTTVKINPQQPATEIQIRILLTLSLQLQRKRKKLVGKVEEWRGIFTTIELLEENILKSKR